MSDTSKKIMAAAIAITPFAFVACAVLAYVQRGYFACGGEFGTLLIPAYALFFCVAVVEGV